MRSSQSDVVAGVSSLRQRLFRYFGVSSPHSRRTRPRRVCRPLAHSIGRKMHPLGTNSRLPRSDSSLNYFDIGDLSYDSQSLVEQDLRRLSAAAGLTIDHTPAKNSSVSIVHDTKVFARLKYDKPAFKSLGFSDYEIETLEKQVTSESPKCLTMTVTDGNNGIVTTVILLSERFNSCLVSGMLSSFGIAASDISAETLIDVCVLYEGRRRGLRDRQSLTRENPKLRNLCITKAGDIR